MKLFLRVLLLALLLQPFTGCAHAPARGYAAQDTVASDVVQVEAYNFDWDDNIFFMPTKIVIFNRKTGEEKLVSTADFAVLRTQLGQPGAYADFETRGGENGSFRYFADGPNGVNYFRDDIATALRTKKPGEWQGPSWKAFVEALSNPETARWTTIITAREHSSETVLEGLRFLQSAGLIKYLPPVENLFCVSNPKYKGNAANPSLAKVEVMKQVLDRIQALGTNEGMEGVIDREGTGRRKLHGWGFSDDDFGNYTAALSGLSAEVKKNRWPDIKITLFFTGGKNNPNEKPRVVVLKPDGSYRLAGKAEIGEAHKVICRQLSPRLLLSP